MIMSNRIAGELVKVAKSLVGNSESDYRDNLQEVNHLIDTLKMAVIKHGKRQERDTENYGYAGDLGHVASELKGLIRFLVG
jgi:hypothetical protein